MKESGKFSIESVDYMHKNGEKHKMIKTSRENDIPRKQDRSTNEDNINEAASSSSRAWPGFKDPRIVRVSRSFGGKDRHSKVYTIRGLRDRRIRLSVPTAIQLYALQDRLGLNQPSKVIDWLLDASQCEIDKLPPLQLPLPQPSLAPIVDAKNDGTSSSLPKINNNVLGQDQGQTTLPKSMYWNSTDALLRAKFEEASGESVFEKNNWIKRNEQEALESLNAQVSSHSSFWRANQSSLAGFLTNVAPYSSYHHQWEPSTLALCSSHAEEPHNFNAVSLPYSSSMSLPPGSQLLVCPSGTTPSFFPPYVTTPLEYDPRQTNHFQMLSSSSQNLLPNSLIPPLFSTSQPIIRPFQLSMTSMLLHSQNNSGSHPGADNGGPSSALSSSFFQNDPRTTH